MPRSRKAIPRRSRGPRSTRARVAVALAAALLAAIAVGSVASGSTGSLEERIASSRAHEGRLHDGIGADDNQIEGFQGSIDDLQTRLSALETSLEVERKLLESIRSQLSVARARLVALQAELARDRKVLVAQVIASYEAPPPDIATVILDAHGFADLIERVDNLRAISRQNAAATTHVAEAQKAVGEQTKHLATLEATHARTTSAVLVQRNEVAQLHLALVNRQLQFIRARDRKSAELDELQSHKSSLEHELAKIQQREAAAAGVLTYTGPVGEFNSQTEGDYGFFQAAGTNYSVGNEPAIAERLNTLGKALHLHLIGISGYRSPQHSVEVGGFANDPHTRGEASDTPGVEGVSEATLNQFGLTRPFPGAAEADHIQLG
jgi:peptidoglycan hydrolase CwlO-like protein